MLYSVGLLHMMTTYNNCAFMFQYYTSNSQSLWSDYDGALNLMHVQCFNVLERNFELDTTLTTEEKLLQCLSSFVI